MTQHVIALDMNDRRVSGVFIRYIDAYTAVVYCGGYESRIVQRNSIQII